MVGFRLEWLDRYLAHPVARCLWIVLPSRSDADSVLAAHLTPQRTLQATVSVATPLMSRQVERDGAEPGRAGQLTAVHCPNTDWLG